MEDLIGKIHLGDCMDILKQLPDKSVDLLLTDPPYGGGADGLSGNRFGGVFERYDNETAPISSHALRAAEIAATRTGGSLASKYKHTIQSWDVAPSDEVFEEMFRVSKNQIIWGGNYFKLPPTRCFNIWKKLTISESFSMAMAEYCWTSFNSNAKVWEYPPQSPQGRNAEVRFHPTQKPVQLICRQLEEYSKEGDLILDCFSGSGTIAVACHKLKRRFIAVEKNEVYHAKSVARLEREQSQMELF